MATSVITRERMTKGKSFAEYMASGIQNHDLFQQNYHGLEFRPDQRTKLRALVAKPNGPDHAVVIGEDWCPDVYRGMPVAARIAEEMGIELRVFERDQNKDMIAEYLNQGEFESIPVFIFYDAEHRELCHFIERPQLANEQMGEVRAVFGDISEQGIAAKLGHQPSEEELRIAREEAMARYREWQKGETWANWRLATVDEVIDLLDQATA